MVFLSFLVQQKVPSLLRQISQVVWILERYALLGIRKIKHTIHGSKIEQVDMKGQSDNTYIFKTVALVLL